MKSEIRVMDITKKIVYLGILATITIILVFTPIGMIQLGAISVTIAHTPTIISSILMGPLVGTIIGLVLGVSSLVKAATAGTGLDILFINPLVSILPRILIGLTTYYSYVFLKKALNNYKQREFVSVMIAGCIGSITNTFGCLGMLYILYLDRLIQILGDNVAAVLFSIVGTVGVAEMAATSIISTAVVFRNRKLLLK